MLVLVSVQVQKELQDAHLLLAWRPPFCILDVLLHRRRRGCPGGVWYGSLRYVTARPATKAPVTATDTYGVVAARWPPMRGTDQHRSVYVDYVPAWHFTDGDVALQTEQARGRCTAGATPAPTRTWDR